MFGLLGVLVFFDLLFGYAVLGLFGAFVVCCAGLFVYLCCLFQLLLAAYVCLLFMFCGFVVLVDYCYCASVVCLIGVVSFCYLLFFVVRLVRRGLLLVVGLVYLLLGFCV